MLIALRYLPIILLFAAVPFRMPVKGQQPVEPAMATALQHVLDSCRIATNVPGISTTFLFPDGRFWNGVTGVAHITTNAPLDTTHVFQGASVVKHFTATIVLQLIEENVLSLDDTLGSFIAPIPQISGSIRLRHLLNHRSGLGDYLSTPGASNNWFIYPDSVWPARQVLEVYNAPPLFAPNAAFSYSNTNYLLLGLVVEAATGVTLSEHLRSRILEPLGLEHAYFPPDIPIEGNLVPGWSSWVAPGVYDTDVTPILRNCFSSFGWAAGALVARPWELAHGIRAVQNGTLLQPASLAAMRTFSKVSFSDGTNGYGLGAMRYTYAGRSYIGHSGDISGFTQMAVHGVQDGITFAISINRNNAPRGPIAAALLAAAHRQLILLDVPTHSLGTVHAWPNPTAGFLQLDADPLPLDAVVELRDITGRLVHHEQVRTTGVFSLDLTALPAGTYPLLVRTNNGVFHRSVIRE